MTDMPDNTFLVHTIDKVSEWTGFVVALIILQFHSDWNKDNQPRCLNLETRSCMLVCVLDPSCASPTCAQTLQCQSNETARHGYAMVPQPRSLSWLWAKQSISNSYVLSAKQRTAGPQIWTSFVWRSWKSKQQALTHIPREYLTTTQLSCSFPVIEESLDMTNEGI